MTRDEMIEKVAKELASYEYGGIDCWEDKLLEARSVLDTIFDALKEPTRAMYESAHGHYEGEAFLPHGLWQAMLNASPLAPKE